MGVAFLASLLSAQFIVWGLSLFHVDSGIWGPYLILSGVSMVFITSLSVNSMKK